MNITPPNHEKATIRAFIEKSRQERSLYLLSDPKRRKAFTSKLSHFKWLDERFAHPIPSSTAHTAAEIATLLRKKGAGERVWVISQRSAIDGQELGLKTALETIWGTDWGTFLSCIPGKLAYFNEEEGSHLLER
jgi:hypothetical protein